MSTSRRQELRRRRSSPSRARTQRSSSDAHKKRSWLFAKKRRPGCTSSASTPKPSGASGASYSRIFARSPRDSRMQPHTPFPRRLRRRDELRTVRGRPNRRNKSVIQDDDHLLERHGQRRASYIAGPVIDKASTVEIEFGTGDVLRLPTFGGRRHRSGTFASLRHNSRQPSQCPCPVQAPTKGAASSTRSPGSTATGTSLHASPHGRPWTVSHHSRTANNSGDIPGRRRTWHAGRPSAGDRRETSATIPPRGPVRASGERAL